MPEDLNQRAKEIIDKIPYITIASVSVGGEPWNTPVFAVHDDDYNFYFGTHKGSQKAKNIIANPNVAVVIYDSNAPAGSGEGVYMKATAEILTDAKEIKTAHKILWDGHVVPYWKLEEFKEPTPLALFKIMPEKVWMNDEGSADGHYIDVRTEINL